MIKEACVESLEQCWMAQQKGADRIELCKDLAQDGLTPDKKLIQDAINTLNIPVRVMVRNRAGNFVYTGEELEGMKRSIDLCKKYKVEGVVFGICTSNRQLDIEVIEELANYAKPLKVTIHKAIDTCDDPVAELKKLKSLGCVDSVLTSGKATTAHEGITLLKQLLTEADHKLEIIACGKVTDQNVDQINREINAPAYHGKLIVGDLSSTS